MNPSEERLLRTRELKQVKNLISFIEKLESEGLKILEKPEFSNLKEFLKEESKLDNKRREFEHQDIVGLLERLRNRRTELEKLLKK